eukprot:15579620-Heterocapsa_arctica.AAC.1
MTQVAVWRRKTGPAPRTTWGGTVRGTLGAVPTAPKRCARPSTRPRAVSCQAHLACQSGRHAVQQQHTPGARS